MAQGRRHKAQGQGFCLFSFLALRRIEMFLRPNPHSTDGVGKLRLFTDDKPLFRSDIAVHLIFTTHYETFLA